VAGGHWRIIEQQYNGAVGALPCFALCRIGVSMGLLVCSKGVYKGELTVGDVVLFLSLMAQLYGPLK